MFGLTYDVRNQTIYYTDGLYIFSKALNETNKFRVTVFGFLRGKGEMEKGYSYTPTVVSYRPHHPILSFLFPVEFTARQYSTSLAYDWITGNLYYASGFYKVVGVCNSLGSCGGVFGPADGRGLALDPNRG